MDSSPGDLTHWGALGALTTLATFITNWLRTRDERTDKKVSELELRMAELREKLPETYARRDDFKDMEERVLVEIRAVRTELSSMHQLLTDRIAR